MSAIYKSRYVVGLLQTLSPATLRLRKRCISNSTILHEVGKLQKPLDPQDTTVGYKTGQLFLHKQFGYRGVILLPWRTKIFENNVSPTLPVTDGDQTLDVICGNIDEPNYELRDPELFYNVLVDSTDSSYVRASLDGVSFLSRDSSHDLVIFTMPGVDLVHNEDIVPYRETSEDEEGFPPNATFTDVLLHRISQDVLKPPITHEFFNQFFKPSMTRKTLAEPAHSRTKAFNIWRKRNTRWLKPVTAFRAENQECGIRVTVIPFYMGSHDGGIAGNDMQEEETGRFWWRYILRVENLSSKSLMLRSRTWSLSTKKGTFDKKSEVGLEGRHVVLSPWNPCTQITCYCSLQADTGSIWGHLHFVDGEGKSYECLIPHFILQSDKKRKK